MRINEEVPFVALALVFVAGSLFLTVPAALACWHYLAEVPTHTERWVGTWFGFGCFAVASVASVFGWLMYAGWALFGSKDAS